MFVVGVQVFAIAGGAQAKVEDMSRALLSHVSQIPGKSFFQQVTSGGSTQPLADFGKKLAVSVVCRYGGVPSLVSVMCLSTVPTFGLWEPVKCVVAEF